jgi:hypothetical protein
VSLFRSQRVRSALRKAVYAYAALLSLLVFSGLYDTATGILGGTEAQLFVASDAPLLQIRATYAGRPVEPRPGWGTGRVHLTYVAFAPMRARESDPLLELYWQTQDGTWRKIHRRMPQFEYPKCLYVVRIDEAGEASIQTDDAEAPVWWRCYSR